MKNIITIQHTQSIQHINGMIGSWSNWDLTEYGIEQAKRIGERLSMEIKNKQYILYSSDLLRARHTAEIIATYLGIEPIFTNFLREFNLGDAIGKSKTWADNNKLCPVWSETIDWAKSIDDKIFIGAESKRDVWARLNNFYNQIISTNNENIIIVSHDGTLSLFFALWIGLDIEMINKYSLSGRTGGVSFLREDLDENRIIYQLNDLSYIR